MGGDRRGLESGGDWLRCDLESEAVVSFVASPLRSRYCGDRYTESDARGSVTVISGGIHHPGSDGQPMADSTEQFH